MNNCWAICIVLCFAIILVFGSTDKFESPIETAPAIAMSKEDNPCQSYVFKNSDKTYLVMVGNKNDGWYIQRVPSLRWAKKTRNELTANKYNTYYRKKYDPNDSNLDFNLYHVRENQQFAERITNATGGLYSIKLTELSPTRIITTWTSRYSGRKSGPTNLIWDLIEI